MRKLAVYRETESGIIGRVGLMPESKTDEEIKKAVDKYNSTQLTYSVSCVTVPDDLCDVVDYLINDRRLNVNRHLEAIQDMQNDIDDMSLRLDNVLFELKKTLKNTAQL